MTENIMIEIGKSAPGFNLPDQNGVNQKLGDLSGKWLLLFFYPKDDTPGWTIEAKAFGESLKKFEETGSAVYGVSQDTVESHKQFRDKYGLSVSLLADPGREMSEAYESVKKRKSFLIDPQGILRKIYDKVTPAEHAEEVLKDLLQMQKEM